MDLGPPEDAQRVTVFEAQMFIKQTIAKWEPQSEVWHFKYAGNIGAIMSCLSGTYVMYHVRRTLKLREHARMTCYLPVAGMSCFLAETFHDTIISPRIISMKSCPTCISIEAGLLQASLGVGYPLILSPLIGFYLSDKLLTYPVPSLSRAPKELFQLWWKLVRMNPRPLIASGIIQGVVMSYITIQKQYFMFNFINN